MENMFTDIVSILLELAAVYVCIQFIIFLFKFNRFLDEVKENEREIKEHLHSIIHSVKTEKHQDMLYWFDNETNEFIAQGKTVEEIASVLKQRWRDHVFFIDEEHIMAGPDFNLIKITSGEDIGKVLAEKIIK